MVNNTSQEFDEDLVVYFRREITKYKEKGYGLFFAGI